MAVNSGRLVFLLGLLGGSSGWVFFWGGRGGCAGGCFASAFCMCLSLVGLSYRGDSFIRLVD